MDNEKSLRAELDEMESKLNESNARLHESTALLNESTEKLQDWQQENSSRMRSVFIIGCIAGSLITWFFVK